MQKKKGTIIYSASDLSNFMQCGRRSALDNAALRDNRTIPKRRDPQVELLQQRGLIYEASVLEQHRAQGKQIVTVGNTSAYPFEDTLTAMRSGADLIYQARLEMEGWQGWADFLIRVDSPSDFGDWSYEVLDSKLSKQTKVGALLQLLLYSEMLATLQGHMPLYMHIHNPAGHEIFRVMNYQAFYRRIKEKFLFAMTVEDVPYPDMVSFCDVCHWWSACDEVRRRDDHLCYVAGLGQSQLRELREQGVHTMAELARLPDPLPFRPTRGAKVTFEKLRDQARLQVAVREDDDKPKHEVLPLVPGYGFFNLPEPHRDDVFVDLEGDPYVDPKGREYLFGYWHQKKYYALWAESDEREKDAFETFIDFAMRCYRRSPNMHIYHYGAYETSAFKRLMLKYATRIEEVEILLRSNTFIDLHQLVRQSVRAGVERYSLKDLEAYHGFKRKQDLRAVHPKKSAYEALLETDAVSEATPDMRKVIQLYNKEDCQSAYKLFLWLCSLRTMLREAGHEIPAPVKPDGQPNPYITQHQIRVIPIFNALREGLPVDRLLHTPDQQVRYLAAHLLDWYGRELKKVFWDKHRIQRADDDELLSEPIVLFGLEMTGESEPSGRSLINTYIYPVQECDLREGDDLLILGTDVKASIESIDRIKRVVRIKRSARHADLPILCVFRFKIFRNQEKIERIIQLGQAILDQGLENANLSCAIDLMLRNGPRVSAPLMGDPKSQEGQLEWLLKLSGSVLPVQGPPGTGKTYCASRLIVGLIKAGKRVGVTALSHKVITNLLTAIQEAANETDASVRIIQKPDVSAAANVPWRTIQTYPEIQANIHAADVIAGTSTFWANPNLSDAVDYLFVDEAGQLSLADTLVCCFGTKNLVLLGDPQQLQQPIQGVHPDGVDVSALGHLLGESPTIRPDQGVFLETTWRMHPTICDFVSDLYYEKKLSARSGLERQRIVGETPFAGSGLFYRLVEHKDNSTYSPEEADEVVQIFHDLTKGNVFWENAEGESVPVTAEHIRIITPYNAQCQEILHRLTGFTDVGTVDKFQGQEAPIVIYSMVTSAAEQVPRGMEFLYSSNRLNVAVSRARAVFILVASSQLFEPLCKTPKQMRLANGLCYYDEKSITL